MDTFKAMKKVNVFKSYFLFISHCLIWNLRNMLKSMCNATGKHIQLSHSLCPYVYRLDLQLLLAE